DRGRFGGGRVSQWPTGVMLDAAPPQVETRGSQNEVPPGLRTKRRPKPTSNLIPSNSTGLEDSCPAALQWATAGQGRPALRRGRSVAGVWNGQAFFPQAVAKIGPESQVKYVAALLEAARELQGGVA